VRLGPITHGEYGHAALTPGGDSSGAFSPPPPVEPYDPDADPTLWGILDEFKVVNTAIDKVVNTLLNEAAEKVKKIELL
jgi:hypothetical protein